MNNKKIINEESKVAEAFVKVNRGTDGIANTLRSMLPQFSGTANYYKHSFLDTKLVLTDGCAYLRETAQCYWLFDLIAQQLPSKTDFIVKLKQHKEGHWIFSCQCFISTEVFYTQKIPYSDFPLPEIIIWIENNIALLPSEH